MLIDELAQRNAHFLFDDARLLHVAGDLEQLGAGIVGHAERGKPRAAAAQDVRHDGDALDIVDRRRRTVEPDVGRERRLQARHALLAFEALDERRLLAADVGAGAVVDDNVEVPAVVVVLADELGGVGFIDGGLQALALADELAAHIDEAGVRPHGERGEQRPLDQQVRIVAHDLAVFARARLALVAR